MASRINGYFSDGAYLTRCKDDALQTVENCIWYSDEIKMSLSAQINHIEFLYVIGYCDIDEAAAAMVRCSTGCNI